MTVIQSVLAIKRKVPYSAHMETDEEEDASFARIRREYPAILTTGQVAELLDLNPRTVLNMAADGRLPASRLPGSRKFHFFLEDILQALRGHMITPGSITQEELAEVRAGPSRQEKPSQPARRRATKASPTAAEPKASARAQRRRG